MNTETTYYLDNSELGNFFSSGDDIGIRILTALKAQYQYFIVPDYLVLEAMRAPFGKEFANWMASENITPTITATGVSANGVANIDNGGEQAILDIIKGTPLPENVVQTGPVPPSDAPFVIGTDDLKFFGPKAAAGMGAAYSNNTLQTQDVLKNLLEDGQLSVDDYLAVATVNPRLNINSDVTPWLTADQAIAASPLAYNPTTNQNQDLSNDNNTDITPEQAKEGLPPEEDETTFGLSTVINGIEKLSVDNPDIAAALDSTVQGLGAVGLAFMGYDILNSAQQAVQQVQAGDDTGAVLTMQNLSARISLGIGGAEIGAEAGFTTGALVGGPFAEITAPVLGIVGAVGGAILGASNAQSAVNAINQAAQSAVNTLSQAVANNDPTFSSTFGGDDLDSILTKNSSGNYQLPSGTILNENTNVLSGYLSGATLATDTSGDTTVALPNGQTMITTSPTSSLAPGAMTPGQSEPTGSTVTFVDPSGATHTATILYQDSNGNYVIDGSTETNASIKIDAPIQLDNSVTIQTIAPPSTSSTPSIIIDNQSSGTDGTQINIIDSVTNGAVQYTQAITTSPSGAVNVGIAGTGDTVDVADADVTLASNSLANVQGSYNSIDLGSGGGVTVTGSDVGVNGGTDSYVGIVSGTGNTVDQSSGTLVTLDDVGFTLSGNSETIGTGAGVTASVNGASDSIFSGTGSSVNLSGNSDAAVMSGTAGYVGIIGGTGDLVDESSGTLVTLDGVGFTLNGSSETVGAGAGVTATINGASDSIFSGAGSLVNLSGNGNAVVMSGTGGYVGIIGGTGDLVDESSGTLVTLDGVGFTLNGDNEIVGAGAGVTATVNGASDAIYSGAGSSVNLSGTSDSANMSGSGDYVGIVSGTGDTIDESDGTLVTLGDVSFSLNGDDETIGAGAGVTAAINGASDSVFSGTGSSVNLSGNNDAAVLSGSGDYVGIIDGTGDMINESGGSVVTLGGVGFTLNGNNNVVGAGVSLTANIDGTGDAIYLNNSDTVTTIGADTINATVDGSAFSDELANSQATTDAQGDATFTVATTGDNTATLTLEASGTGDMFTVGSGAITFQSGAPTALNGADGDFTFAIPATVSGATEDIDWNSNTGNAVLDIDPSGGQTFQSALGTIAPDDILAVEGSTIDLTNSSGQMLNDTTINSDGSQDDTSYNLSGGPLISTTYDYSASGDLESIGYDNTTGSVLDYFTPSDGTTFAAQEIENPDGTGTIIADGQTVTLDGGVTPSLSLDASGDATISVPDSDLVLDLTSQGVTAEVNNVAVDSAPSGTAVFLGGTGATVSDAGGSGLLIDVGNNGTISSGGANSQILLDGTNETVSASSDSVTLEDDSTATVNGAGDTITGGTGNTATIDGNADTLILGSSGTASFTGTGDIFDASSDNLTLASSGSATVNGTGNTIALGTSDTITASSDTVQLGSSSTDTVNGTSDAINGGTGDTVTVTGGSDDLTLGSGGTADIDASGDTTNLSSGTVNVEATGLSTSVVGSDDRINASSDTIHADGNDDLVYGQGDSYHYTGTGNYPTASPPHDDHDDVPFDDNTHDDYDDQPYDDYDDNPFEDDAGFGRVAGATREINIVGQYDLSHGFTAAAATSDAAWNRANAAVAASTDPALAPPSAFEGPSWPSTTITWSFASGPGSPSAPISGSVQPEYQGVIQQAFKLWGSALGITFIQAPPGTKSDIQVGWGTFDTADTSVAGYTTYQSIDGILQPGALIRLEDPAQDQLVPGSSGALTYASSQTTLLQVALHEIGHAIGLGESSDPTSVMFPDLGPENAAISASDVTNAAFLYGDTTAAATAARVGTVDTKATSSLPSINPQNLQFQGLKFLHPADAVAESLTSSPSKGGPEANLSVSSPIALSHITSEIELTHTSFSTHVNSLMRSQGLTAPSPVGASGTGVSGGAAGIWDLGAGADHLVPTVTKPS